MELEKYQDILSEFRGEGIRHRLLGHPAEIQDEMQLDCQLASHGINCGDDRALKNPRVPKLEPGASDWQLLLQIDSDKAADMMWGDDGRLFFWIRKQDLAARRFNRTWLMLQSG